MNRKAPFRIDSERRFSFCLDNAQPKIITHEATVNRTIAEVAIRVPPLTLSGELCSVPTLIHQQCQAEPVTNMYLAIDSGKVRLDGPFDNS